MIACTRISIFARCSSLPCLCDVMLPLSVSLLANGITTTYDGKALSVVSPNFISKGKLMFQLISCYRCFELCQYVVSEFRGRSFTGLHTQNAYTNAGTSSSQCVHLTLCHLLMHIHLSFYWPPIHICN